MDLVNRKKKKNMEEEFEEIISWFGNVYSLGFYGISTLVGYLIPIPVHTHTHIYIYIYIYIVLSRNVFRFKKWKIQTSIYYNSNRQ